MYENRIALSVAEVAELTGYSNPAIRKFISLKLLKATRPGGIGDYRILRDDVIAWLRGDGCKVKPRPTNNLSAA